MVTKSCYCRHPAPIPAQSGPAGEGSLTDAENPRGSKPGAFHSERKRLLRPNGSTQPIVIKRVDDVTHLSRYPDDIDGARVVAYLVLALVVGGIMLLTLAKLAERGF